MTWVWMLIGGWVAIAIVSAPFIGRMLRRNSAHYRPLSSAEGMSAMNCECCSRPLESLPDNYVRCNNPECLTYNFETPVFFADGGEN